MIGKEILNYVIVSKIGEGGTGTVYLAENKFIRDKKVAIKVLRQGFINNFMLMKLKEEAEKMVKLDHPNIVKLLNYHIDENNAYLVMEYIEGPTLGHFIKYQNGLIVESRLFPLIGPILQAFDYAHKQGVVHRDIKPGNIIIQNGIPKILDFGISSIINSETDTEKQEEFIMGTPSYMSPEQVRGKGIDFRSDIYSLGVLLYVMVTGNEPYDTKILTETSINKKVLEEPLPRIKTKYKYISNRMQRIVDKATCKTVNGRYQNCTEFYNDLKKALATIKIRKRVAIFSSVLLVLLAVVGMIVYDYNSKKYYNEQYLGHVKNGDKNLSLGITETKNGHKVHFEQYFVEALACYDNASKLTRNISSKSDTIDLIGRTVNAQKHLDDAYEMLINKADLLQRSGDSLNGDVYKKRANEIKQYVTK